MKFHPPHKTPAGHLFAINDHGTAAQLTFQQKGAPVIVTLAGEDAKHLHAWLDAAALRTQAEADALGAAPAEKNTGIKVEMNDQTFDKDGNGRGDGTHRFAQTEDELTQLQAIAATNLKTAQALIADRKSARRVQPG